MHNFVHSLEHAAISQATQPSPFSQTSCATPKSCQPSCGVQVKGFPTLMLVDGTGNIRPFEGDRTKEGLVDFIEANSVGASSSAASKEEL